MIINVHLLFNIFYSLTVTSTHIVAQLIYISWFPFWGRRGEPNSVNNFPFWGGRVFPWFYNQQSNRETCKFFMVFAKGIVLFRGRGKIVTCRREKELFLVHSVSFFFEKLFCEHHLTPPNKDQKKQDIKIFFELAELSNFLFKIIKIG